MSDVLAGVRVVEVAMWAFVPAAGAVLADWGAEVTKIVHPEYGDPMRGTPVGDLPKREVDVSFMWEILNRGKRSIGLDLANPEGLAVLADLVRDADVFLTSFLPPARRKLGIDVEDIRALNAEIIYARGTGQGPRGPEAEKGGYDHTSFWARSGIAHAAHQVTGEFIPQVGPAFGDLMSGFSLASGITAALLRRDRTGQTSVVDVSLLGTGMFAFSPSIVASELYGVDTIPRVKHADQPNPMVAGYATKDGRIIYIAGIRTDRGWTRFCELLGRPELATDPRFRDNEGRVANRQACIAALDEAFATRTLAEWREILEGMEDPWTVVQSARELHSDPQAQANRYVQEVMSAAGSTFPLITSPVQLDEQPPPLRRAPDHGEHTEQILLETGRSWDDIKKLKQSKAVL